MNKENLVHRLYAVAGQQQEPHCNRSEQRVLRVWLSVLLSDYVADHEAFLGDFKKVCANLAENIGVKSAYDIDTNSYKYSGIAIFDCAPAIGEAIVKLVKATD